MCTQYLHVICLLSSGHKCECHRKLFLGAVDLNKRMNGRHLREGITDDLLN